MIHDIQKLLDDYSAWLKDKTQLRQVDNEWVEITTPYLDRHNDYLQIYATNSNGEFILTDDGYTIGDLEQTGCELNSPKRRELLNMTLNGFGVQLHDQRLEVHTSRDNFPLRKHNLIQAILAVNDLFYLAAATVASLFNEDVAAWLDLHEIRYTPRVKFTGKTGYDHMFDFVIPKSRNQPERMIRAINHPNQNAAKSLAFAWFDTREIRPPNSKAYAFLNNIEEAVSPDVNNALQVYDVRAVLWSKCDDILPELAA